MLTCTYTLHQSFVYESGGIHVQHRYLSRINDSISAQTFNISVFGALRMVCGQRFNFHYGEDVHSRLASGTPFKRKKRVIHKSSILQMRLSICTNLWTRNLQYIEGYEDDSFMDICLTVV